MNISYCFYFLFRDRSNLLTYKFLLVEELKLCCIIGTLNLILLWNFYLYYYYHIFSGEEKVF